MLELYFSFLLPFPLKLDENCAADRHEMKLHTPATQVILLNTAVRT